MDIETKNNVRHVLNLNCSTHSQILLKFAVHGIGRSNAICRCSEGLYTTRQASVKSRKQRVCGEFYSNTVAQPPPKHRRAAASNNFPLSFQPQSKAALLSLQLCLTTIRAAVQVGEQRLAYSYRICVNYQTSVG